MINKIKTTFKRVSFTLLVLLTVVSLSACNDQMTADDIVGTWETVPEEAGEEFFVFSLTFNADGSGYGHLFPTLDTGYFTWQITDGNNLQMESELPISVTLYDISLENNVLSFNNINGEIHPTFTWMFHRIQ